MQSNTETEMMGRGAASRTPTNPETLSGRMISERKNPSTKDTIRVVSTSLLKRALLFGFGLFFLQILIAMMASLWRWELLAQWDSEWYASIIDNGYVSTIPPLPQDMARSNVAFFPGFPLLAAAMQKLTGLSTNHSLILTAQLAALVFWTYFYLLLDLLKLPFRWKLATATFFLVQPGSFFLISGYSESLFLSAIAGYVYFSERALKEKKGFGFAAFSGIALFHGIVMTGTRAIGAPIVFYPLARVLVDRFLNSRTEQIGNRRNLLAVPLIAVLSLGGIAAFFLFCHLKFGQWNLYSETIRIGWGGYVLWERFLELNTWISLNFLAPDHSNSLGVAHMDVVLALGPLILWKSWKKIRTYPQVFVMALFAYAILIETMIGRTSLHFAGMIRYLLPVYLLLVPVVVLLREIRSQMKWKIESQVLFLVTLYSFLFAMHVIMIRKFINVE